MKKLLTISLSIVFILGLVGCGAKATGNGTPVAGGADMPVNSGAVDSEKTQDAIQETEEKIIVCEDEAVRRLKWPDSKMASLIPKPSSNCGHIEINGENELLVEIYNATQDDFHEYLLRSNIRFDKYEKRNEIYYSAYDEEGNILELDYYSADQMMKIHVYESREAKMLQGIEHYELEYYSCYASETMSGMKNYDRALDKYLIPVRTTVEELKKDFPFNETSPGHEKSVTNQSVNLEDNREVWVYATYLDNYNCDVVKFIYDELRLYDDTIDIKTHFEIIERLGSSTKTFRLIVISIIPAE